MQGMCQKIEQLIANIQDSVKPVYVKKNILEVSHAQFHKLREAYFKKYLLQPIRYLLKIPEHFIILKQRKTSFSFNKK